MLRQYEINLLILFKLVLSMLKSLDNRQKFIIVCLIVSFCKNYLMQILGNQLLLV